MQRLLVNLMELERCDPWESMKFLGKEENLVLPKLTTPGRRRVSLLCASIAKVWLHRSWKPRFVICRIRPLSC